MKTIDLPVVFVTGVSSGVGLELARLLWLTNAYRVVITARRESLHKIKNEAFSDNERFLARALDVTSSADREKLVAEIMERFTGRLYPSDAPQSRQIQP